MGPDTQSTVALDGVDVLQYCLLRRSLWIVLGRHAAGSMPCAAKNMNMHFLMGCGYCGRVSTRASERDHD
eukprot:scaffold18145_cov35-Tisochrysis_lutea.AAC.2